MVEEKKRHDCEEDEREHEKNVHRGAIGPAAANRKRRDGEIRGDESEQYKPCVVAGERFAEDCGEPREVGDCVDAEPRPRNCIADLAARLGPDDDASHIERVDDREEREVHEHRRLSAAVRVGSAPDKAHQDGQHRGEEVESRPQPLARDIERAEVEDEKVEIKSKRKSAVAPCDNRHEIAADEPHHRDVRRAEVDGHNSCEERNAGERGEREDWRGDDRRVEEAVAEPEAEIKSDDAKR